MLKIIIDDNDIEYNYNLLHQCIVPRPVFLISTCSAYGDNLAPFSYVSGGSHRPPIITVAIHAKQNGEPKDTLMNIHDQGEFILNAVDKSLEFKANLCASDLPRHRSEFDEFDIKRIFYDETNIPHVAESPYTLYCKVLDTIPISKNPGGSTLVIGQIIYFYIKKEVMGEDNLPMLQKTQLSARLGIDEFFTLDNLKITKLSRSR